MKKIVTYFIFIVFIASILNASITYAQNPTPEQAQKKPINKYDTSCILVKFKKSNLSVFGFSPPIPKGATSMKEVMRIGKTKKISSNSNTSDVVDGLWYKIQLDSTTDVTTAINSLKSRSDVLIAQPNYVYTLGEPDITPLSTDYTDPFYKNGSQWYINGANVKNAWEYLNSKGVNPGGSNDVVVAVIDTGVNYKHEDLSANILYNSNGTPFGINTSGEGDPTDPMDAQSHGTMVAGIIAAQANNDKGVIGIANNVKIMPIRAGKSNGEFTDASILNGINFAITNNASILNLSLGGASVSDATRDALSQAQYSCTIVSAAGNSGLAIENTSVNGSNVFAQPIYPAAFPFVLSAMSRDENSSVANNGGYLSAFSNWDPTPNSNLDYLLMAPGSSIVSTSNVSNTSYSKGSGTSFSSPVVAGVVALMRSYYSDKTKYNDKFIFDRILNTCDILKGTYPKIYDTTTKIATYDFSKPPIYYRSVNALSALQSITTPKPVDINGVDATSIGSISKIKQVMTNNIGIKNVTTISAYYDNNGALISTQINTQPLTNGQTVCNITPVAIPTNASKMKIITLDDFSNITPLTSSVSLSN